jgi:hypothetical protein
MHTPQNERQQQVQARVAEIRAEFDNYEKAVTLISSVEQWLLFKYGPDGQIAHTLQDQDFDRFPQCDGLTPDFLARFLTNYRLCGEVVKTYRQSSQSPKDLDQVVRYTRYLRDTSGTQGTGDLLLLVHPHTIPNATADIAAASEREEAAARPQCQVVIVSYIREQGANGEWYDLKWWDLPGNSRFSYPNAVSEEGKQDLNDLLTRVPHCGIPVDLLALDISARNPLINDPPPPLYTVVRVIFPAINELLTEEERDTFRTEGRVEKRISWQSLMSADCMLDRAAPQGLIQSALAFMAQYKWAARVPDTDPPEYTVVLDMKNLRRDLKDLHGERAARDDVDRLLRRKSRARKRAAKKQLSFDY